MPSRRVSFDNSVPGTPFIDRNKQRRVFTVHVVPTQDAVQINDGPMSAGGSIVVRLEPGESVSFGKDEGHDVTKPWYINSVTTGTNWANVYEDFG